MTNTSVLPDVGVELREGYADVGDQSLHYVDAGDGPLIVLLHGFPEFWFGWRLQIEPLGSAGFGWVAPAPGGSDVSSRQPPRPSQRARGRVRDVGRSRLGRIDRLDHRDEPPRGGRPTRHPQRGPSAAAPGGAAPPESAPKVLVLLLLCDPAAARGRRARQRLAFLPTLPGWREGA